MIRVALLAILLGGCAARHISGECTVRTTHETVCKDGSSTSILVPVIIKE